MAVSGDATMLRLSRWCCVDVEGLTGLRWSLLFGVLCTLVYVQALSFGVLCTLLYVLVLSLSVLCTLVL